MKFFRFIFQLPNIKLWYFYFLLTANIVLYYEIKIERDRTIMVSYKYDRNELIKARVKNYYFQANYRILVKNYSKCKQGK
jgi:hypothetical protein